MHSLTLIKRNLTASSFIVLLSKRCLQQWESATTFLFSFFFPSPSGSLCLSWYGLPSRCRHCLVSHWHFTCFSCFTLACVCTESHTGSLHRLMISYYCNSRLFLNPADIYIIQHIDAPSIQFLPLIKFKVAQGEEPIPAVTEWAQPGQATDGLRRMTIHAHIKSKAKFKSPTTCMCINCGATRTSIERTGRLHRSQRAGGLKPRILLLWCDTADHHTTVLSSHWHVGTWLSKALPSLRGLPPLSSQIYTGIYWTHWFPFL